MGFLQNITVELDAETQNVAERLSHRLFELLLDEDYVMGLSAASPYEGGLLDSEEGT